jgi:hypothetical protein
MQEMVENKTAEQEKEGNGFPCAHASVFLPHLNVIKANSNFDKDEVSVENQ